MSSINLFAKDFPILRNKMNGKPLVYLDNAATTQKPVAVIKALEDFYKNYNANIHRGIYEYSLRGTDAYENTRQLVARFINARKTGEVIFTRNATESINLVAYTWGEKFLKRGDNVIVSILEHHSNLIPWQELCKRKRAVLKFIPLNKSGNLDLKEYKKLLSKRTKIVAVSQMSNVTGVETPIKEIVRLAKLAGAMTLVDGAQGVPHLGIDVQKLGCDFLAFSSHKMCGPTGVGVLYGREESLNAMPPFLFGGEMNKDVTLKKAVWNDLPWRFEAGTPNIADVIAFAEAIKYLQKVGMNKIIEHDRKIIRYAVQKFRTLKRIKLYLPADLDKAGGILSFNIPGVHPHDVGSIFDREGVAIRVGFLCAEPFIHSLGAAGVARMSFYFYNTTADIDKAFAAAKKVYKIFGI